MLNLDNIPSFISQQELAELLDVHVNTVMRWRRNGKIRAYMVGRHWRIHKDDIKKFLEEHSNIKEKDSDE
jgi:excisionase family DNA binding protein